MNLDSVIYHRNNGLNNPNNSRYSLVTKDSIHSSKYDINNVNSYIKSLPYSESSFRESLDLLKETEKETDNTNVLYDTLSEMVYHINDIEYCKDLIHNSDIHDNILESTIDNIICVDRMKRNFDKLNSLINIDSIIESNKNDSENLILELCDEINKFKENNSIQTRINLSLETALYLDAVYDINIDNILENVSQYYLLQEGAEASLNSVLETNKVIKKIKNNKMATKLKDTKSKAKEKVSTIKGSVKEDIAELRKTSIDDFPKMKSILYRIYTKSPENVIEETPNILSWIRNAVVFSSLTAGPIGLVPIIVDKFIEFGLNRKRNNEMIKIFEKEISATEKKLDKAKQPKTQEKYEKYLDELNNGLKKLEDRKFDLDSNEDYDNLDESTKIRNEISSISINEYMDLLHHNFIATVNNASTYLHSEIKNRFKFLIEDNAFSSSDVDELDDFIMANKESIKRYISPIDNKITVRIGIILPLAIRESYDKENLLDDLMDELCSNVLFKLPDKYNVFYDGDYDMYNIYVSSIYRISSEDFDRKEYEMEPLIEAVTYLELMERCMKNITSFDLEEAILENVLNYSSDDLVNIYEYNEMLKYMSNDDYIELLEEMRNEIHSNTYNPCLEMSFTEQIKETSKILNASFYIARDYEGKEKKPVMRDRYTSLYETYMLSEYVDDIKNISIEESVKSSLKIAREKLIKNAKTLSAKEKILSNKLDNAVANLEDTIQKKLSNKNREQVIRGSVLPSLSTIVKIAIGSGVAYLIDPALAAITVVGSLAMSKHSNAKERQYILDEIDIELKMVEKKMQLAEANNDMEAMEQLLRTERRLQRERKRIFYKLRANHYPGTK